MWRRIIVVAALALAAGPGAQHAVAQEQDSEREREAALERQQQIERERRAELEIARERMEEARRELEEAARAVAELSAGAGRAFVRMLPEFRGAVRAELGIAIEDGDQGVRVTGVTPGGAAAEAGVAVGDVIVAIDGVELAGAGSETRRLLAHLRDVEPGQNVDLRVLRDGETREIAVTTREPEGMFALLGTEPGERIFMRGVPGEGPMNLARLRLDRLLGGRWSDLELVALTEPLGSYFGTSEGLLVVRAPDDDATGLMDGDVILAIGGRTPTSPEHAMRILMSFEPGETLELSIMRRQRRETIEYVIPEG